MKKAFGMALALVMCVCLAGCGQKGGEEAKGGAGGLNVAPEGKKLKVAIVFDTGGLGDKSFNDSAWAGVERAKKELGIDEMHVDSKSEKDYETNLTAAAEGGSDLVLAIGISMKNALEKVAPQFKEVKFAIVDATVDGPNVRSLLFKEEEGSFLAGYLAGLMSKTGKIGFVGGMEIPLIKKFECGYIAGAKTANTKIEVLPAKYTGSWDNADVAKSAADVLYGGGADVVYHAAGRAGLGVFRSAKDNSKWAIGVDSDQDDLEPGTILTSMIKKVDEAVFATIKDLKDGKFTAEAKTYDLKAGGVGLSPMKNTKDLIGKANLDKIESIKTKMTDGEITAPNDDASLKKYLSTVTSTGQ